ncbi:MAG: YkvA family protein, partial [Bacteroidota bacterium]
MYWGKSILHTYADYEVLPKRSQQLNVANRRFVGMKVDISRFRKFFSESRFWQKMSQSAGRAGQKLVYSALLLYYAYKRKETPSWAKRIVLGSLGYLIMPLDFIPDLSPILGYTDDLGVISFGLVTIAAYINDDIRDKARTKLTKWFGE